MLMLSRALKLKRCIHELFFIDSQNPEVTSGDGGLKVSEGVVYLCIHTVKQNCLLLCDD